MKLKAILIIFAAWVALIIISIVTADAGGVYLDTIYNNQTIDVDKDPGDDSTCMHAAMASAITFAVGDSQEEAVKLYRELVEEIGDKPIRAIDVWDHLMNELNPPAFARYYNFDVYAGSDYSRYFQRITGALTEGWVVIASIIVVGENIGHAMIVYGTFTERGKSYIVYCDNEDFKYQKHFGRVVVRDDGKTYMSHHGNFLAIESYAKVRVTENVIKRGRRK